MNKIFILFFILINQNCFSQQTQIKDNWKDSNFHEKIFYCIASFKDIDESYYTPSLQKAEEIRNYALKQSAVFLRRQNASAYWHAKRLILTNKDFQGFSSSKKQATINKGVNLYLEERAKNTDSTFRDFLKLKQSTCEEYIKSKVKLDEYINLPSSDVLDEILINRFQ